MKLTDQEAKILLGLMDTVKFPDYSGLIFNTTLKDRIILEDKLLNIIKT